ncbi:MAG: glucokinase [Deferrisomatales bacterium]
MTIPWVLAGDIGGTKANLALFDGSAGALAPVAEATLRTADHPDPASLLRAFLGERVGRVARACLGVAGPVRGRRAVAPNLPWGVDADQLQQALHLPRLTLVNDLVATALGLAELGGESLAVLTPGSPDPTGAQALLAAGTGLGQAALCWDGRRRVPVPSEGGHTDFGPTDDLEIALLTHLRARFGRVSYERILSGPGLVNLYRFLVETGRAPRDPGVAARMELGDPAAAIAGEGLAKTDPACVRALELFARICGAEAGNLALKFLATGGVYLAGGIAPQLLPVLRGGGFLEAFRSKGRLAGVLAEVPVYVVLDPKAALYGAARRALGGEP